ncbi:MAG: mechanosensitive ion channel [Kofleriaceae bacterium]|nr:mechanosensitive ion channel [Myxococcales bacterium]MCB9559626.1 mechanosensitive ion channel [Kofleriaceae bacterium]MCB9574931.1 mechanosensitive ion channel [Kofleriaceae bacterium]
MFDDLLYYLRLPLVTLSGTDVTPLSLLTAIAIVVAARIVSGFAARSLARVLSSRGTDQGVAFAVAKITRYAGTIIGLFVALGTIGVNMSAVVAAAAVLLVGIGFGLQKMAENFISGLILLVERPVRRGDFIEVGGVLGTVEDIGLRATKVVSLDAVTVFVPNGELVSGTVINHSVPDDSLRVWIRVGVAYGTDLDLAQRVLLDVARAEPQILAEPAPTIRHEGFGDSSIDLAILAWIDDARDVVTVRSNLLFAIDKAFRAAGIEIPFPQRDVHVKSLPAGAATPGARAHTG